MSNEIALAGIKDILNKLEREDLHGLTITVTQGLLKYKKQSRHEAIEIILKYSPDVLSILKRRALTKDILFTYLHDNNIIVELPTTKDKLITKVCKLWKLSENVNERNDEKSTSTNLTSTQEPTTPAVNLNSVDTMARQFSQWFYEIMNNNTSIDQDHFYPDAHLKLNLLSNSTAITEETETPKPIVDLLFKTKTEHNLYFNPNLNSEGVQGRLDPHGLVMVLTCGTLHSNNSCVGVFEQVFALARDPFCENNWKIKNTELNLRSKSENIETPCLSNSELTSKLLSLPGC